MEGNLFFGFNTNNNMNRTYRDGKHKVFLAKDLTEAYNCKFFQSSMARDEMIERILRYNSNLKICTSKNYKGIFDTDKGENGFVCGITHNFTIPKYSIMEYNFSKDRTIQWCTPNGEKTNKEIVNDQEHEYKVLARGWLATFDIVERKGYKIDKRGL